MMQVQQDVSAKMSLVLLYTCPENQLIVKYTKKMYLPCCCQPDAIKCCQ